MSVTRCMCVWRYKWADFQVDRVGGWVCVSWSTPKYMELLANGQSWSQTRRQEQSISHVQEARLKLRRLEITQNRNVLYCGENWVTDHTRGDLSQGRMYHGEPPLGHSNISLSFTAPIDYVPRYLCLLSAAFFTIVPLAKLCSSEWEND
jgi:hypothetical protein